MNKKNCGKTVERRRFISQQDFHAIFIRTIICIYFHGMIMYRPEKAEIGC